jgi:hypothetical protein
MIDTQQACAEGQRLLSSTRYLHAEQTLTRAETRARAGHDWDGLARLYMPLQESRRQRRQRCGEGVVRLDLLFAPGTPVPAAHDILRQYPHGQLLVAAPADLTPAAELRRLAWRENLYVDVFLAATYAIGAGTTVLIAPTDDVALPPADVGSIDRLHALAPPHSIILAGAELPAGATPGNDATYAYTMSMWEKLHAPFLARAWSTPDAITRIDAFRRAIEVDYACERAHQDLCKTAADLARTRAGHAT